MFTLPVRTRNVALAALVLLSFAQNVVVYRSYVIPHVVSFSAGMNNCVRPIAYWLRDHSPDGAKVVAPDVGLLGYVSDKVLYDPAGLITPELRSAWGSLSYDEGMRAKRYEQVVHPDFIVDRSQAKERLRSDTLRPVMTAEFPGLGIGTPNSVYYTLYKVMK